MSKNYLLSGFADEIDKDLDLQIKTLKELNMSYLVLRSAYGKNVSGFTLEEAKEVKDKLDENGIKVSSIGSPIGKIEMAGDFEKHFELYKHVVVLTKLFETKYIRMFSFFMPVNEDPKNSRDVVIERLQRMIDYAKEQDIILLHENEKAIYGDNIARCKDLMETLYCDNFKQILDFANFVQVGDNPLDAYNELKPYIEYIHIKDADKETLEIVIPGQGDGHIAEVVALLKEVNFDGFYSLEPHLMEFDGLQGLEREGDTTVIADEIGDGPTAFKVAHKAFTTILEEA